MSSSHAVRSNGRGHDAAITDITGMADKAHAAVDSTAALAAHGIEQVGDGVARGARMAHRAVDSTAGTARRLGGKGAKLGHDLSRSTTQYAAKHPFKALGIALGVGFLLARIIRD